MTTGSVLDNPDLPPASRLLGWRLRAADPATGTVELGFTADDRFLNPVGLVQGGFIAAMLDDAVGSAVIARTEGQFLVPTITLTVGYIAPARPGAFVAVGRIISMGKTVAHLEGELFDAAGTLVARATAVGRVVARTKAGL